jgi:hypothetical protein
MMNLDAKSPSIMILDLRNLTKKKEKNFFILQAGRGGEIS